MNGRGLRSNGEDIELTVKIVEINAKGIVIEADKMLFLDQDEVISYANKNKIFIKGMKYD